MAASCITPSISSTLRTTECIGRVSSSHLPKNSFLYGRIVESSDKLRSASQKKIFLRINNVASEPKSIPAAAHPGSDDVLAIASNIKYHAEYTPSYSAKKFETQQAYLATAQSIRETLIQRWNETFEHFEKTNPKMVFYLSMEYLQGRTLLNALGNLQLIDAYSTALEKLGVQLEDLVEQEPNAALGNGGLGRLASCFLDSIATLNYPGWGYGLRYKYGLFKQSIGPDGQIENAEPWLETGYPWEIPRFDISYPIQFFGEVIDGKWTGGEKVKAVAYDLPIPGYKTKNCISLRLWSAAVLASDFDLPAFNSGDHEKAIRAQANADKLCSVLYPGDSSIEGKTLRLKQQYMLCSASLQDIIAQFVRRSGEAGPDWFDFPNKVAVQMNDTHPTLSSPELMRILIDVYGLGWNDAWKITQATVAYTNHTVLPEALEKWPLNLVKSLLPRHFEIISKIDEQFMLELLAVKKDSDKEEVIKKIESMRILENVELPDSVILSLKSFDVEELVEEEKAEEDEEAKSKESPAKSEEKEVKKAAGLVRMANLCVISGHAVNGVAQIHSDIVKDEVFNDYFQIWPEKFQNKTNGVTPRRWIKFCNPSLSALITKYLGNDDWVLDADKLQGLTKFADDKEFQSLWKASKLENKTALAKSLEETTGYVVNPNVMFDIQVKRIHEYKRQLMNIMGIIYRYKKMKEMSAEERKAAFVPRACIFGGKAFATYWQAKRIVKLIVDVGNVVNNDSEIGDLLKVIFVPDYNVSVAEALIPASELSQHISTAGMEASGTSNMKFMMNGCLVIGTLDGANVEIREEIGDDNFFLFGAFAHEIAGLRKFRAAGKFVPEARFVEVKDYIRTGVFGSYDYSELLGSLEGNEGFGVGDYFLVGHDFPSYVDCQTKVDEAYRDQEKWTKASILSTATSGKFSSDRTIHQYAKEIWGIDASPVS